MAAVDGGQNLLDRVDRIEAALAAFEREQQEALRTLEWVVTWMETVFSALLRADMQSSDAAEFEEVASDDTIGAD